MRFLTPITTAVRKAVAASFVTDFKPVRETVIGWVKESFPGAWQRNVEVDNTKGLTANSAVYSCLSRISNDVAKLKPNLVSLNDGMWSLADPASPFWKVLRRPNGFQNRIQFLAYWLTSKLLYGNTYVLKLRDARTMVTSLYILDPRRVMPLVTEDGDVYYQLGADELSRIGSGVTVPASEIIHDRMNCLFHPLVGIPPIYACALGATQARQIQNNSSRFFENMSRPSGLLTAPGTVDDVTAKRMKTEWQDNFSGGNIGRLAVLGDGLKYEPMTIPAEQAQLIEQLDWTVVDTARAFGMPLYKIGAGPMPSGGNVEASNQQYYSDCLQEHIEAIELCLDEGLSIPADLGVELDLDGLMRMDQLSRIEMLTKAVTGTVMAPNEARRRINLAPKAGGDALYLQQQNYSLEALAKRDAQPDPFAKGTPAATPAPSPAPAPDEGDADKALMLLNLKAPEELAYA